METLRLDGYSLTIDQVYRVANAPADQLKLSIHPDSLKKMKESREFVFQIAEGQKAIYSINTGFGALADKRIEKDDLSALQYNLIRSHCTGVGKVFDRATSRAIVLLRANCLTAGHSGINPDIVQLLLDFLNDDVTPLIPSKGSVGASGDLAPLAHVALTLIGEGEVVYKGKTCASALALKEMGKSPAILGPKDGLALINGTAVMAALGALAVHAAQRFAKINDLSCALTLESLHGTGAAFHEKIQLAKPHPGQIQSATNLRTLLAGSEIASSHKDCNKIQDPYSLRCAPQVHGACRQTIEHTHEVVQIELNSITDNPLIFPQSKEIINGGNFHGESIAMAMDYLALGMAEFCAICERRVEKMMNPQFSELPAFLTANSGLNSGMMIAHVTVAALTSENKILCHPASIDSIPTSTDKEDHVSMGVTSGRKLFEIIDNLGQCLAIELLCSTQALEFSRPLLPPPGLLAVYNLIRKHVRPLDEDRILYPDIQAIKNLIDSGALIEACEKQIGELL